MSLNRDDLIGVWTLEGTFSENVDGTRTPTLGPDPKGVIIYTADGYMTAITGRGDRSLPVASGSPSGSTATGQGALVGGATP